MGIQGLLSFLEKASRPAKISEFSGCTVAVDSYCWLHKGAFSCAEKLARGEKTDQYVKYCMKFVNMLLSFNIKPIMVFDGRHLPAKAETEKKRRELREANRKKAAELLRLERESEARSLIQRCVDVTHEMALALMKECRAQGVDCIVAPYEADAQLAYLNLNGLAHVIITEDSDLLLFGCKLVLFKMDVYGNGVLVDQNKIPLAMKQHPNQFSMDKFRYMCILSGCDYLKSLPGIGLAKACKFIKKTQDDNISRALTRLGAYLNMANLEVTIDYRDNFVKADRMFKHQPVFDPLRRVVVPLTPLPPGEPEPLPNTLDPEVSFQLALGNLNPFTLERVDSWDPDQPRSIKTTAWKSAAHKHKSIWSKDYVVPKPLPPKPDPRDVNHSTTKGKTVVQPVTTLTDRITALPTSKSNLESELSRLRESYAVKAPAAKRLRLEDTDSGIGTEGSSEELTPQSSEDPAAEEMAEVVRVVDSTPPRDEGAELTVDDLLGDDGSPVLIGGRWKPNPFHAKKTPQAAEPTRRSLGGALDMFSKLKKTHVEAACIVQSRYFSDEVPKKEERKPEKQGNDSKSDLTESLMDIINSTPSPKRKSSLIFGKNKSTTPRKNLFEVMEVDDSNKKEMSSPVSSKTVTTPRKNVFSVTSPPKSCTSTINNSSTSNHFTVTDIDDIIQEVEEKSVKPKEGQSLFKILDEITKDEKGVEKKPSPQKGTNNGVFKWSQPILDKPQKSGTESTLIGLYKPKPKLSLPSKSPKSGTKKGATSKGRPSLPVNANFKQKPPPSSGQTSLLNMFAFKPKPKLTSP